LSCRSQQSLSPQPPIVRRLSHARCPCYSVKRDRLYCPQREPCPSRPSLALQPSLRTALLPNVLGCHGMYHTRPQNVPSFSLYISLSRTRCNLRCCQGPWPAPARVMCAHMYLQTPEDTDPSNNHLSRASPPLPPPLPHATLLTFPFPGPCPRSSHYIMSPLHHVDNLVKNTLDSHFLAVPSAPRFEEILQANHIPPMSTRCM